MAGVEVEVVIKRDSGRDYSQFLVRLLSWSAPVIPGLQALTTNHLVNSVSQKELPMLGSPLPNPPILVAGCRCVAVSLNACRATPP